MTVALVISVIIFIFGVIIKFYASRLKPNWLYGYRSTRSLQSKKAWVEGNRYCGSWLMVVGPVVAIIGSISNYALKFSNDTVVLSSMIGLVLLVFIAIVSTEMRLKKIFAKSH